MTRFPVTLSMPNRVGARVTGQELAPYYAIYEQDGAYVIEFDMPGVDRSQIELNVEGRVLNVRASREMHKPDDYKVLLNEFGSREYSRSFELGEHIDENAINATYENGVLRVELQRKEEAQVRKIAIN